MSFCSASESCSSLLLLSLKSEVWWRLHWILDPSDIPIRMEGRTAVVCFLLIVVGGFKKMIYSIFDRNFVPVPTSNSQLPKALPVHCVVRWAVRRQTEWTGIPDWQGRGYKSASKMTSCRQVTYVSTWYVFSGPKLPGTRLRQVQLASGQTVSEMTPT